MTGSIPAIERTLVVPVGTAAAWAALTDPERVATWFTDASPVGAVGDEYRLDFGDSSIVEGTILAIEPGRSFAYAWRWAGAPSAETTSVTWSVAGTPDGTGSSVRLVHDGWAEAGLDRSARDDHDRYWAGYLDDLAAVLTDEA